MLWEVDIKALAVIIWYCLALHMETVVSLISRRVNSQSGRILFVLRMWWEDQTRSYF